MWRRFGRYIEKRKTDKLSRTLSQSAIFTIVTEELRNDIAIPKKRWRQHTDFSYLRPVIESARQRVKFAEQSNGRDSIAAAWLRLLVLQAPHAVQAQTQMDRHKHGFHNKAERVMELIDFNDAYVSTVLAMPTDHLRTFNDDLRHFIDWFCKRVGSYSFSDEQFEAIIHGLSREIAVYNSARASGFEAIMTNRAEDAFGIDLKISTPESGRTINVDIKTNAAFRYRLLDLMHEGRLAEEDVELADQRGYVAVLNSHENTKVRIIIWRIDNGALGNIIDFTFEHTDTLISQLKTIITEYGE